MGVGRPDEGAGDLDIGGRGVQAPIVRGVLDRSAQTGLHRESDGGRTGDNRRVLPPGRRTVGGIGSRLRRQHDVVPAHASELDLKGLRRPGHEYAGALALGRGGDPQTVEVELGLRGQRVLGRMPHWDHDKEPDSPQAMSIDDMGVAGGCDLPVADRDQIGVGGKPLHVGVGVGLDPVEWSDQTGARQVHEGRENRALAGRSDEDRDDVPMSLVVSRRGHCHLTTRFAMYSCGHQYSISSASSPDRSPEEGSTRVRISRTSTSSSYIS